MNRLRRAPLSIFIGLDHLQYNALLPAIFHKYSGDMIRLTLCHVVGINPRRTETSGGNTWGPFRQDDCSSKLLEVDTS